MSRGVATALSFLLGSAIGSAFAAWYLPTPMPLPIMVVSIAGYLVGLALIWGHR
jgi:hypothetical protein